MDDTRDEASGCDSSLGRGCRASQLTLSFRRMRDSARRTRPSVRPSRHSASQPGAGSPALWPTSLHR